MSKIFAERLKHVRKAKAVNQKELSAFLSVAQNTISNWEIGRTEPDTEMLNRIAKYFDVTADYLLGGTDIMNRSPSFDEELASKFRQLSPILQESITNLVDELIKKSTKK